MGFALSDIKLTSTAFKSGEPIPVDFTGEGADISPSLSWGDAPEGARSFAVICHDPDAPLVTKHGAYGFIHWVLYNIPASVTNLAEGNESYANGKNDFGKLGYGGPMPPGGHGRHQYYFWILAMDKETSLEDGLSMGQLLQQLEPNLIGMNRLVGTYERS